MSIFFKTKQYPPCATVEKHVGETPLEALERLRATLSIPREVPMAYAGRLDPMASGKLIILIGEECKRQEEYHHFDKRYDVEVLLGASSDTGDVLGLVRSCESRIVSPHDANRALRSLVGDIELPYPVFSSKTVDGKPLHVWANEGRLGEIEVPVKRSSIYRTVLKGHRTLTKREVLAVVRAKIATIPPVDDPRKALGADFRRERVYRSWDDVEQIGPDAFQLLSFSVTVTAGTYMRSLAGLIGEKLGTCGLAYSIHRDSIGTFLPFFGTAGVWISRF